MGTGSCEILLRVSRYLMNEHLASKRKPSLLAFQKENALRGNNTPISANEFSDTRNQSLVCFMPIHFDLILI